jgi:sugar-specific transcriptional regulator TrmB
MKYDFFTLLGFSDKEELVYTLLVQYGALSIADIVKRSPLHRPYTYKTVSSLLAKQVIDEQRIGKRKVYSAKPPHTLKALLETLTTKAQRELSLLEETYSAPNLVSIVKTIQGKKTITEIFADLVHSLKKGDVFYRYTSEENTEYVNRLLPKDYRELRDKKDLERFVIANVSSGSVKQGRLNRAMKIIPNKESTFNQNCIQLIYGNKLAFIDITNEQGIIIENANLAQFQKEIFKMLYKRL